MAFTEAAYLMDFIVSIVLMVAAWILVSSQTAVWYNGALLVAVITAAVSFAAGQFSLW